MPYDFKELIIFDMANNHQGSISHGIKIIDEIFKIMRKYDLRAAIKLQYRDLSTFIHPDFINRKDVKHIPRFMETRLNWEDFQKMTLHIKERGLTCIITAFDEQSVEMALNHGVDILKVASCSCMDWPLLESVAKADKPIICSTGGCVLSEVDKIVSFFEHRNVKDLALLHCIAMYPTENRDQQLQFMHRMMIRYPNCTIGYSGHEAPDNLNVGQSAVVMGAQILERHVGIPTDSIKLNAYSMNPEQTARWVESILDACAMLGPVGDDKHVKDTETNSLRSLMRGAFARRSILKGDQIKREDIFFAMPCLDDQTTAGEYQENMLATRNYLANEPLYEIRPIDSIRLIRSVVHEAKAILREANIPTGTEYEVELSHHLGIDQFRRVGATIVNFINREYCKKLIIMLPGQFHPSHMHKIKEETFQVLYGDMELDIDEVKRTMKPGDMQLVRRGQLHSFSTRTGLIFEEISTTHTRGDSHYVDERITRLDPIQRKTFLENF